MVIILQYIPDDIQPTNRNWIPNEHVILRTTAGEWTVGISTAKNRTRFSGGWNSFARDNKLKYQKSYTFTLLNDEEDDVIFYVEKN